MRRQVVIISQDIEGITDGTQPGTSKKSNKAEEVVSFKEGKKEEQPGKERFTPGKSQAWNDMN